MTHVKYVINLSVDTKLDATDQRAIVEEAINEACVYIEKDHKANYISYNIGEVVEYS